MDKKISYNQDNIKAVQGIIGENKDTNIASPASRKKCASMLINNRR